MTRSTLRASTGWTRIAGLALIALLTATSAPAASRGGPDGTTVPSAAVADPILAYQYNTSNWAFASSSDAYRAMARADPKLEGLTTTLTARIFLAYNLATLGRGMEAEATLNDAERLLTTSRGELRRSINACSRSI